MEAHLLHKGLVRIVAGRASDSAVVRRVAPAPRQPVALKAYVLNATNPEEFLRERCPMARATEFIQITGTQGGWIENARVLQMSAFHRRDMVVSRSVAPLTANPGNHLIQLELAPADRRR
jgi:hypothetical protein